MTALFPYIAFENSKEALAYYEEVFGATDVKRLEVGEEQASHFGMTKEDADKVEAFYEKIKDHSSIEIELPLADQFWGGKMGIFTDKYGVRWMLHGQDYTAIQQ
ncbi:TPA: glyoxalase/bleomycin resistance/extradiol dioxygenase family protein [Staphylococcus aureus]|nr:glyoxalase/bleomycin resistance/extradiol dioxygenase family protein [Staphylococcus aureus]